MEKKRRVSRFLIALTLILAFLVGGFGVPGFLLGFLQTKEGKPVHSTAGQTSLLDTAQFTGASRAFRLQPRDGVTVSTEDGALERAYDVTFTPVETETLQDKVEEFIERTGDMIVPLFAYDLDAGMDPHEMAPGFINMEFDLEKLGVFEEFMDQVLFYRIDDDGVWSLLASKLEEGIATVRTRQNSVTLAVIALGTLKWSAIMATGVTITDWLRANWGEIFSKGKTINVWCRGWIEFQIKFSRNDMLNALYNEKNRILEDKMNSKAVKDQSLEYVKNYRKEHPDEFEDQYAYTTIKQQYATKLAEEMIAAENGYADVDRRIQEMMQAQNFSPENLSCIIDHCETMYAFMVDVIGVNIPWYCVEVYLDPNLKEYGKTVASTAFGHPWMYVRSSFDPENDNQRDDCLVTLTHEYYHCMQRNYRDGLLCCPKYDEATAQLLELYCRQYYLRTGQIVTDKDSEYTGAYELYGIPLNAYNEKVDYGNISFDVKWSDEGVYSGYAASSFITFLEQKGSEKTYLEMLEAYNWSWLRLPTSEGYTHPPLSEMLRGLFSLTEDDLEALYRQFMVKKANAFKARWSDSAKYAFAKTTGSQGEKVILTNNRYTTRLRQLNAFVPPNYSKKVAVLVVQDEGFSESFPKTNLFAVGNRDFAKTKYGLLFSPKPASQKDNFWIYELTGNCQGATVSPGGGYTVWTLLAPEVTAEVKDNKLNIKLPVRSEAARAGYVDGYRVTIKCSDGTTTVKHYKISASNRTISLLTSKLCKPSPSPAGEGREVTFKVSICEYIKERDGTTRYYGPESDPEDDLVAAMNETLVEMGAERGVIEIALGWQTADDLDLHVQTPGGEEIYFANKSAGGGKLDVDMQVSEIVASPAEHVTFPAPAPGVYKVWVVDYTDRTEGSATPFVVVVKIGSQSKAFNLSAGSYSTSVCTFEYGAEETDSQYLDTDLN